MGADTHQPTDHVCHVGPKHAAVGVQFVQHDIAQATEKARPAWVMRQNALMQHVRVRQDNAAFFPKPAPHVGRGVAVICAQYELEFRVQFTEAEQAPRLILGQGLGGKHVERCGVRRIQKGFQRGQLIAQRLPAGGRGNNRYVLPLPQSTNGIGLMGVKPLDSEAYKHT